MDTKEPYPKRTLMQVISRVLLILGIVLAIAALIALMLVGYSQPWTGFGDFTNSKGEFIRGKTLWDWLQLLIVPAVLAVGALLFNWANGRTERKVATQREKIDRDIASDNAQEALLQSYLDRMTDLLLKNELRISDDDSEVRAVAKARTVTVLRRLDQARRASLLTFLSESKLIGNKNSIELLIGANLSGADLRGANLNGADLSGADLMGANLSWAYLMGANLSRADLSFAYLSLANLSGATLSFAGLSLADLSGATLSGANLSGANLSGAYLSLAHLSGADLSGADLSRSNLDKANLRGAKYDAHTQWPDGFKPPPEAEEVPIPNNTHS